MVSIGLRTTLAGSGSSAMVDGYGTMASFGTISSVVLGSSGQLYVGDTSAIRVVTPSGMCMYMYISWVCRVVLCRDNTINTWRWQ